MTLDIVPLTPEIHAKVCAIHVAHKRDPPRTPPHEAVVVVTSNNVYVASAYLYHGGPAILGDFFCGDPGVDRRLVHTALEIIVEHVLTIAAQRGVGVVIGAASSGVRALCLRYGFRDTGIPIMVHNAPRAVMTRERSATPDVPEPEPEPPAEAQPEAPAKPEAPTRRRRAGAKEG